MATYKDIQNWVKINYDFVPKTCWIAHCKELSGLSSRVAYNRQGSDRMECCPEEKRDAILAAFKRFGML